MSINTWYHITCVIPPTGGGGPYVLLNNANKTFLGNYTSNGFTSNQNWLFGDAIVSASGGGGANGYINNFYLFNRVLSDAEITALFNQ